MIIKLCYAFQLVKVGLSSGLPQVIVSTSSAQDYVNGFITL